MRGVLIVLVSVAVLSGFGAADVVDGVLTVAVEGSQDGYTADQLAAINGGTVTEIVKTGAGTLVSKGISSYAGKITVSGGILSLTDSTGLGTTAGATHVEDGAAVSFASNTCGSNSEEFHIVGTGVSGSGALVLPRYAQVRKLTLEGDAKIVCGDRAEMAKATDGFFDFQNHTLTLESATAGSGEHYFSVNELKSVGTVVANNFKYFRVQSDVPLVDGQKGKFILRGTTSLLCNAADATNRDIRWDLEWEEGSSGTTYVSQSPFNWTGDWIIGKGRQASFDGAIVNHYGNLIGAGDLYKGNNSTGEIRLYGTNRVDFTGNFQIRGGCVVVMKKAGLMSDYLTRVQFTNMDSAMLALGAKTESNPDGFEAEDISSFFVAMKNSTVGVKGIYVADGDTFTGSVKFDSANTVNLDSRSCDKSKFGSCGGGTCILTGPFVNKPSLKVYAYGDLRISNPSDDPDRVNALGRCWIVGGTLTFDNAGTLDFDNNPLFSSGSTGAYLPNVKFTGATRVVNGKFYSPNDGNNQNGRIAFGSGVVSTNYFAMSTDGAMDAGSAVVNGGDVTVRNGDGYIGSRGQGAFILESGRMNVLNFNYLGMNATGVGQIFVHGGTYETAQSVSVGCAGTGVLYQTSGTIKTTSALQLGNGAGEATGRPYAAATIAGGEFISDGDASLGSRADMVSMLNLIGGSFQARRLVAQSSDGAWSDVAFNGGTLKASATTSDGWEMLFGVNLIVTVYAGGAAFDTSGVHCNLGRPLVAATGKGVASIAMPQASYAGFAAPPVITISGDGRGASAVPIYDSLSGTVTGIRVTSPGYGYTEATATMNRGSSDYYTTSIALIVTLADNTSPVKLTKKGAGRLTIRASEALPSNAIVAIEEGTLDGDGVTFAEYAADVAKAAEGVSGSVPSWPEGARLSISNLDQLDPEVGKYVLLTFSDTAPAAVPALASGCTIPDRWKLCRRGKELMLCLRRGLSVVVR